MSSLPRKTGGSVPGGLAAVAQQRASAAKAPLPSSQYLDAINVLCEATMLEACALALSEKDYEETPVDDAFGGEEQPPPSKSDYKKLLEIEKKCRHAAKVVHKEAIPAPSAMMPPSLPTIPAARVNLNSVAAKKSAKMGGVEMMRAGKNIAAPVMLGGGSGGGGKAGVVPLRRGSMAGSRPMASNPNKRTMAQQQHQLHHSESDESSLGSERNGNNPAHKKARLAGSSSAVGVASSDAPPPSALTFLKMLNKDPSVVAEGSGGGKQTKNKGESKASGSGKDKEKVTGDDSSDREGGNKSDNSDTDRSPSSQREGTRKNPSRGARR